MRFAATNKRATQSMNSGQLSALPPRRIKALLISCWVYAGAPCKLPSCSSQVSHGITLGFARPTAVAAKDGHWLLPRPPAVMGTPLPKGVCTKVKYTVTYTNTRRRIQTRELKDLHDFRKRAFLTNHHPGTSTKSIHSQTHEHAQKKMKKKIRRAQREPHSTKSFLLPDETLTSSSLAFKPSTP